MVANPFLFQLLPLLRYSLEGKSKSWSFSFYALLANILSSFTNSPTEPDTDMTRREEKERKKEILDVFWEGCTSLCLECVLAQVIVFYVLLNHLERYFSITCDSFFPKLVFLFY